MSAAGSASAAGDAPLGRRRQGPPVRWSSLPSELVVALLVRLPLARDKAALSAVCCAWREAVRMGLRELQLPWDPLALDNSDFLGWDASAGPAVGYHRDWGRAQGLPASDTQGSSSAATCRSPPHPNGDGHAPTGMGRVYPANPGSTGQLLVSLSLFPSLDSVELSFSSCPVCAHSAFQLTPQALLLLAAQQRLRRLVLRESSRWGQPRDCPRCNTGRRVSERSMPRLGHGHEQFCLSPSPHQPAPFSGSDRAARQTQGAGPGELGPLADFLWGESEGRRALGSAFQKFCQSCSELRELHLSLPSSSLHWEPLPAYAALALSSLGQLQTLSVGPTVFQPHSLLPYTKLPSLRSLSLALLDTSSTPSLLPLLSSCLTSLFIFPVLIRPECQGALLEDQWGESPALGPTGEEDDPSSMDGVWRLPDSLSSLVSLKSLSIAGAKQSSTWPLAWDGEVPLSCRIPSLSSLRNLEHLQMGPAPNVQFVQRGPGNARPRPSSTPTSQILPSRLQRLELQCPSLRNSSVRELMPSLSQLTHLDLFESPITSLAPLSPLPRVLSLTVTKCHQLRKIPASLVLPNSLNHVSISRCPIAGSISEPLARLINLVSLNVGLPLLDPLSFSESLQHLSSVCLSYSKFKGSEGLSSLPSLAHLSLSWDTLPAPSLLPALPTSLTSLALECPVESLGALSSSRDCFRAVSSLSLKLYEGTAHAPTSPCLLTSFLSGLLSLQRLSLTLHSPLGLPPTPFLVSLPPLPRLQQLSCCCQLLEFHGGFLPSLQRASLCFPPLPPPQPPKPFDEQLEVLFGYKSLERLCLVNASLDMPTPRVPQGVSFYSIVGRLEVAWNDINEGP